MDMEMSEQEVAGATGGTTSNIDDLLAQIGQQFNCMGTTDKDVLVNQLVQIIGPQLLNPFDATFFLEMNNWNLQGAVGSYFDLVGGEPKHLRADDIFYLNAIRGSTAMYNCNIVKEEESNDKSLMVKIVNTGNQQWPVGCHFLCLKGSGIYKDGYCVLLSPLSPNQEIKVLMRRITMPHTLQVYPFNSHHPQQDASKIRWQMITPDGHLFGSILTIDFEDLLVNKNLVARIETMDLENETEI